jgi:D-alanyl-D-alanine carboxypeptidase
VDEVMTVRDALFGLMLNSSNECASALAVYTAGSIPAFTDMMNARAQEIGAVNTHFVNAHGLHNDDHYTTPHDMALIFQEALKNDEFRYIDSSKEYIIPQTNKNAARTVQTTNSFLNGAFPYEGVFAGKTGNTPVSGRTLCTAFYRDGIGILTVIMKSGLRMIIV